MKLCSKTSTHVAHVRLQLSDAVVLWRVQDHREVSQVLLCLYWVVHLEI